MQNNNTNSRFMAILKIALPMSFLWAFFETVENASLFYSFFPRGGFFKITFDTAVLKFLALPILKLFLITCCLYFLISWLCAWVSLTCADVLWKNRGTVPKRGLSLFSEGIFHAVNIYTFLYLTLGYNAFLHPRSYNRHPFIYEYMFPIGSGPTDIPEVNFLNIFFYICAVYWCLLLGVCLIKLFKKGLSFCRGCSAKRKFIIAIIMCALAALPLKGRLSSKGEKFTQKDNVIFIGLDSFQYNQLSSEWGAISSPAPDILNFVKEATYFRHIWTPFARTFPSYTSILTGRYPFHNGIRANLLPDEYEDPDNIYLGEILGAKGYRRFYATDDVRFSNIRPRHGFDEIFTPEKDVSGFLLTSFYDYSLANILMYYDIFPRAFATVNDNRASAAYNPKVFMRHVIERIDRLPRDKRQFIVIHLCSNHHPYTSAYPYARDPVFRTRSEFCMRMVNDQVKMLVDYLKKSGLYENSLIVLLSDHGSGWDPVNDRLSHGSDFEFLEAYKSILAITGKGLPQGKAIQPRVRTIDIYPTVLQLLGLKVPKGIDGKSLVPLVDGKVEAHPRTIFAETGYTFDFYYEEDDQAKSRRIQREMKRFRVDPQSGYIFINDEEYQEILERKWFMMIEGDYRFVYRPWKQDSMLYDMEGHELEDEGRKKQMNEQIETLMIK